MAKETISFQSVSPDFRPQLFHPKHMDTCRLNHKKQGAKQQVLAWEHVLVKQTVEKNVLVITTLLV